MIVRSKGARIAECKCPAEYMCSFFDKEFEVQ